MAVKQLDAEILEYEKWLQTIGTGRPKEEVDFIRRACQVAQQAHQGQKRASGEPFFHHSLAVADLLVELGLDYETVAAAVLHDVPEDTATTLNQVEAEFGETVAKLVDGVTKMGQIQEFRGQSEKSRKERARAETLRKMFLAMIEDVRVVLIKLTDRTHNMRTLAPLNERKQKRIAKETLDIFAPLADRLGIWNIKCELEDLAFRYLEPDIYAQLETMVENQHPDQADYIQTVGQNLEEELRKRGVLAEVSGRPKHIYSIWREMKQKGIDFDQCYDIRRILILVNRVEECYLTLGTLHSLWRPLPGEFFDYIASPKDNLYQSLHTAVIGPQGKTIEVQIRTYEMQQEAEYGVAAHWRYNEAAESDVSFEKKIAWLRQLMEWKEDVADAKEFIDQVKAEVLQERVYVLTPKGDIYDLPAGATPIDFAYYIHTEVGHRCRGAKVNGKIVELNYQLKDGDQVEILTVRRGGPAREWLDPHLGYIKTSRARSKIRHWFKHQDHEENISQGRTILNRESRRLNIAEVDYQDLADQFNFPAIDDFLAAVGRIDINTSQLVNAITDHSTEEEPDVPVTNSNIISSDIEIQGVGNMSTSIAQCCRPVPDKDEIIGYITRCRSVSIHRRDCANILRLNGEHRERLIAVDWGATEKTYPIGIVINAFDRPGLLRDITAIVANEKINFSDLQVTTTKKEHTAKVLATLDVTHMDQLSRVLALIAQVPNVIEVRRRK